MMNRQICRFAYRAVFAQRAGQEALVHEHADVSPVLRAETIPVEKGEIGFHQTVFEKTSTQAKVGGLPFGWSLRPSAKNPRHEEQAMLAHRPSRSGAIVAA
jgi:hypothetical protein